MALAVSGAAWIAAEEIGIQIYINSPCPGDMPCDKVIGRSQVPPSALLIIAGGIVFVAGKIVLKPASAPAA